MSLTKQGDEAEAGCVTVDQVRVSARYVHILHIPGGFLMTVFKGHRQKLCSQNIMFQEHNLTSAFYDISV